MHKFAGKALYVFLCSLMGMMLFLVLHRSLSIIYFILLDTNFSMYSFGLSDESMRAFGLLTGILALLAGGWYGTGLGLHWYKIVYEEHPEMGLFHAMVPHHWRDKRAGHQLPNANATTASVHREKPGKIVHIQAHTPRINTFDAFESFKPVSREPREAWSFDDIDKLAADAETPVK